MTEQDQIKKAQELEELRKQGLLPSRTVVSVSVANTSQTLYIKGKEQMKTSGASNGNR